MFEGLPWRLAWHFRPLRLDDTASVRYTSVSITHSIDPRLFFAAMRPTLARLAGRNPPSTCLTFADDAIHYSTIGIQTNRSQPLSMTRPLSNMRVCLCSFFSLHALNPQKMFVNFLERGSGQQFPQSSWRQDDRRPKWRQPSGLASKTTKKRWAND